MNWALETKLAVLILVLLAQRGECSIHELADALRRESTEVIQVVSQLEEKAWVVCDENGRVRLIAAPEGITLYSVMEATDQTVVRPEEGEQVLRLRQRLSSMERGYFSELTLDKLLTPQSA